ncbi:MAG: coproporphyrinogen III oxidase [Rhodobacter sp. BACL10 MAG-121220-bin24]|jgi:putative oxygen-independent coproporphyrinogen III oxidase|nr:MAG: coproporphyrinogen III oxidase [Rhodobacter sp. BACL10 MAG-121220-bin24]
MDDWRNGGFGLYIHWPFCQSKCPYCDFNSHVAAHIDQDIWLKGYLTELDRLAPQTEGRLLNSVFFGGGTPSLMEPRIVEHILARIDQHWTLANDVEITLEANPTSVEAGRFKGYRAAGVNRISMGIQALNDPDLKALGRLHSANEAAQAFDIAIKTFNRVSFDLIYARQNQTLTNWETELTHALSMAADHLSLYQLTIEDGTAFGDRLKRGGLKGLPDDEMAADFYELTQALCTEAGFAGYEVSNYAKEGAQSRHNLVYWRSGDYMGIGPGAHGRLTLGGKRWACEAGKSPALWLEKTSKLANGESPRVAISPTEQADEYLMMSLRLAEGTDIRRYENYAGGAFSQDKLRHLTHIGMITQENSRIMATTQGRMVLNSLIAELATP